MMNDNYFGKESVIEVDHLAGNPRFARGTFGEISIALYISKDNVDLSVMEEKKNVHPDVSYQLNQQKNGSKISFVAIKTIVVSCKSIKQSNIEFGEVSALRQLCTHPNIKSLLAVYPTSQNSTTFKLVSAYCPTDLYVSIEWRRRIQPKIELSLSTIQLIVSDVVSALQSIHTVPNCMIHNDIKPGNLLVSTTGMVQLCDFGLVQQFNPNSEVIYSGINHDGSTVSKPPKVRQGMTTLHYRSPEVLLGGESNHPAIDMYSVGVVLGELLLSGRTLFLGTNEMDQLNQIFSCLGTPSQQHWPNAKLLPYGSHLAFIHQPTKDVTEYIPRCTECTSLLDFLRKILTLDPERRLTSTQALQHPWLQNLEQGKERGRRILLQEELIPPELVEPFIWIDDLTKPDFTIPIQQALEVAAIRRSFLTNMDVWTT
jgi:serine/threonine protein kinase